MKSIEFTLEPILGYLLEEPQIKEEKGKYDKIDLAITLNYDRSNPAPITICYSSKKLDYITGAGLTIAQTEELIDALSNIIEFSRK